MKVKIEFGLADIDARQKIEEAIQSLTMLRGILVAENGQTAMAVKNDPFLDTSIKELKNLLSNRPLNVLLKREVKDVAELVSYTRKELLEMENMGINSVNEIVGFLASHGLTLKK